MLKTFVCWIVAFAGGIILWPWAYGRFSLTTNSRALVAVACGVLLLTFDMLIEGLFASDFGALVRHILFRDEFLDQRSTPWLMGSYMVMLWGIVSLIVNSARRKK